MLSVLAQSGQQIYCIVGVRKETQRATTEYIGSLCSKPINQSIFNKKTERFMNLIFFKNHTNWETAKTQK